jgi:hypothetical protein
MGRIAMSSPIIGAIVAGAICGLVPLVYGIARGHTGLAVGGFLACLVGGVVLGVLLAVPLAALFAWLIWRNTRVARPAAAAAPGEPLGTRPEEPPPAAEERFAREPERDRQPVAHR